MNSTVNSSGRGVGFGGLLTILFIGLKLTGYIGWSWWWVLCPLWGPLALIGVFCGFCFVMAGICWVLEVLSRKKKK